MAEDWIDKLVRDDDNAKREAKGRADMEAKQERDLQAQWPGYLSGLRAEAEKRVEKFNASMQSRRSHWRPLTFSQLADNFTVELPRSGGLNAFVNVTVDHNAHAISVTTSLLGFGSEPPPERYQIRTANGNINAQKIHYSDVKYVPDLLETILRPLFQEAMQTE